jgi:hypothetical protein
MTGEQVEEKGISTTRRSDAREVEEGGPEVEESPNHKLMP